MGAARGGRETRHAVSRRWPLCRGGRGGKSDAIRQIEIVAMRRDASQRRHLIRSRTLRQPQSLTKADAIFAARYGHVITVQDHANEMEAAHEIDDLCYTLFTERILVEAGVDASLYPLQLRTHRSALAVFLDCIVGQLHIVRTTRNCALPLIMRA